MATFHELSTGQLRQALQLREQIESLQQKLNTLLGGGNSAPAASSGTAKRAAGRTGGKRTMSAEARAKIAAAATARWAKIRGTTAAAGKTTAKAAPKKKGGMTPEGRAKIAAAMKARWAAKKKGAAAPNASTK